MSSPPPPSADPAARAWAAMRAFVAAQDEDRRQRLRAAFDFGRGKGRVGVLLTLADGPLTMGELAESQNVDPPNLTVIVDKLEGLGLVRRTPHPEGNRRKLVALTDAGHRAAVTAREIVDRPAQVLADLPPDDLAALERILGHLAATAGPVEARVVGVESDRPVPPGNSRSRG